MGATNIVVEGFSDQRALVSGIQRFGNPSDVDDLLNLNTVTFVSAGGASHVKRLVEKSTTGDERRPIVVVLLDGDDAGQDAYAELTYGSEPVLEEAFVATLDKLPLETPWTSTPKVIEDVIPPQMLAAAAQRYLKERWDETVELAVLQTALEANAGDNTACDRLVEAVMKHLGSEAKRVSPEEAKSQIHEVFHEMLLGESNGFGKPSMIRLKRAYDEPSKQDGMRILVERLGVQQRSFPSWVWRSPLPKCFALNNRHRHVRSVCYEPWDMHRYEPSMSLSKNCKNRSSYAGESNRPSSIS